MTEDGMAHDGAAQNGAAHDGHDHGELADFGKILFGAMALVAVLAVIWAFGAALGPAQATAAGSAPVHALSTSMTHTIQQLR